MSDKSLERDPLKQAIVSALIALMACGFTYALRGVDSVPLKRVISLEDDFFDYVVGHGVEQRQGSRPVVLIDIDDSAIGAFQGKAHNSGETPRALVAKLMTRSIEQGAAFVYVDIDLRSDVPDGDKQIQVEIGKASETKARDQTSGGRTVQNAMKVGEADRAHKDKTIPNETRILLPSYFETGMPQPCRSQSEASGAHEYLTRFAGEAVEIVHPLISIGPYSIVEGACSAYKVQTGDGRSVCREAAMVVATQTADERDAPCDPHMVPIRWIVGPNDGIVRSSADGSSIIYARISARWLLPSPGEVPADLSVLYGAIVIIGSTHPTSGDTQPTPAGAMPGALVQANLALTLQAQPIPEIGTWGAVFFEVVLILLAALCSFLLYHRVKGDVQRNVADVAINVAAGGLVFLLFVVSARTAHSAWRFGLLTCVVTTIAIFAVTTVEPLAEFVAGGILRFQARVGAFWTAVTVGAAVVFGMMVVLSGMAHASELPCPVESLVAQVVSADGDPTKRHLIRDHRTNLLPPPPVCLRYGDEVSVDPGAHVVIALPVRQIRIGSPGEPRWVAPASSPPPLSAASATISGLKSVWAAMTAPIDYLTVPAMGRGSAQCPAERPATQTRLAPVAALRDTDQVIGADLSMIEAAWKPLRWPGRVEARLTVENGQVVAEGATCSETHLVLPLAPGTLVPGSRLTLEVRDGPDSSFLYTIKVVAPGDLTQPPVSIPQDWLVAAWRLGGAPGATHIDALARLQAAPKESLAARRLLEAIWHDVNF